MGTVIKKKLTTWRVQFQMMCHLKVFNVILVILQSLVVLYVVEVVELSSCLNYLL